MKMIVMAEDDFKSLLAETVSNCLTQALASLKQAPADQPATVHGIAGLAGLYQCSLTTAQKIKNELPANTYSQKGRKVCFFVSKVLMARPK